MFLHGPTQSLVTIRRQLRGPGVSPAVVEFIDRESLEIKQSVVAMTGFQVQQAGDLFVVTGRTDEGAVLSAGRVQAGVIEFNAEVTPAGMTALGDDSLLALLPERLDVGAGRLLERSDVGLRLRVLDLDRHLQEPYPNEMPPEWRLTPDRRHAILWRVKGSTEWPVIDLDADSVVHRIQGLGHNEPRLGFGPADPIHVGVSDQLHELDSIFGQLSKGVRLKADNSGSYIHSLHSDASGAVSIVWFGRGEPPALAGVETVEQLWGVISAAQKNDPGVLFNRRTYGSILRIDPSADTIEAAAPFANWVIDPIVNGTDVLALDWRSRTVVRSRFSPIVWPTHAPREPGEKMWF